MVPEVVLVAVEGMTLEAVRLELALIEPDCLVDALDVAVVQLVSAVVVVVAS